MTLILRVTIFPPSGEDASLTQVKRVGTWKEVGDIRKLYPDCHVIADEIEVEPYHVFDPLAPRPLDFKDVQIAFQLVDSKRTREYFKRAETARRREAEVFEWLWPESTRTPPEPGK